MNAVSLVLYHQRRCASALFVALIGLCFVPSHLQAQGAANSGQIVGEVLDPDVLVVVGTEVTARNTLSWNYSHHDRERGNFSSGNYDSAHDLDNEYGFSTLDQRHQFMANGLVFLPAGFEFSSAMRFNSARPIDARAGSDLNGDGVSNRDRATQGGSVAQRNSFRNIGYSDVSRRVQKFIALPNEKGRIAISAELLNVFDFDNVEVGGSNWTYGPSLDEAPTNANFGRVKDSSGEYLTNSTLRSSPFQVQLGLRFEF